MGLTITSIEILPPDDDRDGLDPDALEAAEIAYHPTDKANTVKRFFNKFYEPRREKNHNWITSLLSDRKGGWLY